MAAAASAVGAGKPGAGPAPAAAPAPAACLYSYLQQPAPQPRAAPQVAPAPPERDSSSLRGVRVGPGHEKFPSWPGSAESEAPEGGRPAPGGGSHRSKSWTDHTSYPKERAPPYCRPYMKRPSPAYTQQLKTVMERCEKIPPEAFLSRDYGGRPVLEYGGRPGLDYGGRPGLDYGAPSPPERDKPDQYSHQFQTEEKLSSPGRLTQRDLEEYARAYGEGPPSGYAPSEGYHSYVSGSDCSSNTPFLDRLRRDSAARPQVGAAWDEPPERDGGGGGRGGRCDSVVTTSSGSASSSETLKWHGSLSDVSVASGAPPPPPGARPQQLSVAHSARVQTPQRHHSESVLYLGSSKLRLFPVSTYTVQPQPQPQAQPPSPPHRSASLSSPTQTPLSVAERVSELERQQTRYTYLDPEKRHRVSDPTLKAIQKKALLSFYERHHAQQAVAARPPVWRSEPQLTQPAPPPGPHSPPPPQPPPRPRTSSVHSARRASSASDYAGGAWREIASTREIINESGNLKDGSRHQHSSSCGSLSTDLLGPLIVGPSISVDDWVPERPPKKPHLRSTFPLPLHDRLPSPDLPPPSPPPTVEDEVFASDEPLPPPPPDLPPAEGSPLPSPTKLQDRVPTDCITRLQHSSTENELLRIPERSSKRAPPCSCHVNRSKQWETRHNHVECRSLPENKFVDSLGVTSNSSEYSKQVDGAINNNTCVSHGVSHKHFQNNFGSHYYLQNGHSSEKYSDHLTQQPPDNYSFRSRFQDNYRSQRYSEHPQKHQGSTSSLPRYAESQWVAEKHSEVNPPRKSLGNCQGNCRPNEKSDTVHRYSERGHPQQRYSSDGNTSLPRTHEYRYVSGATVCNVHADTSNIQRHSHNKSYSASHSISDNCLQKFSSESTVADPKTDNSAETYPECQFPKQQQSANVMHQQKPLVLDDSAEKTQHNGSQKSNSRISPCKVDKEVVPEKYVRSNSIGNKSLENDSPLQKVTNNRLLKSSENISSLQKMPPPLSYSLNNSVGDPSPQTSRTQGQETAHHNQSDIEKQGHFQREYHQRSISRTLENKYLSSSRSFDNGTQQRYRQDQNSVSRNSFDSSGLTQTNGESNTQTHKYTNCRNAVSSSQQNSVMKTPVYRNSSRMYSRPQALKPVEINCQNEGDGGLPSSPCGQANGAAVRCSTQKLVVNGKLASPLHSDRSESERVSGTAAMPARARLQRLPGHSGDCAAAVLPAEEGDASPAGSPESAGEGASPPSPLQLSTSKAATLAARRERFLPSFEGSYKRTASPPDEIAVPECDRLVLPERAAEEEESTAGVPLPTREDESSSEPSSTFAETRCSNPPDSGVPPEGGGRETSCDGRDSGVEIYEDCVLHASSEKICEVEEEVEPNERLTETNLEDSATESTRSETESQQGVSVGPAVGEQQQLQLVQRSEVVLRVNAPTSDAASQTELDEPASPPARPQSPPQPELEQQPPQAWPPARRKLQEEIECEQLSLDLASKLPPTDKLQGLLVPDPDHKKPTDYVSDLFRIDVTLRQRGASTLLRSQINQRNSNGDVADENCEESSLPSSLSSSLSYTRAQSEGGSKDNNSNPVSPLPATSAYFTTSESKAKLLTQYGHDMSQLNCLNDNKELHQKKEELMLRLDQKLEVLRGEHLVVLEESRVNDELGETVAARVSRLARPHEASKYRLHVEEVGKITSLLLGLSGRLARAENALVGLPDSHTDRKILESKRDKLIEQLEEAKKLKESIDRRSVCVSNILNKYFNPEEYADYDHFINMKAKLIMDSKEIADKIKLGEEQLSALRETLSVPE